MSEIDWKRLILGVAAATALACAGQGAAPPGEARDMVVVDPGSAATLTGRVLYDGPEPAPAQIDVRADPACAEAAGGVVPAQDLVVNPDHTLRNAVVFVKEGLPAGRWPVPE